MNLTEHICHMAARYDAVAFDVFDTLIRRDTAAPTNLFRLRGEAFYTARTRAEREARAAKSGEVTLAEIYDRPCLAGYDPAQECAAELAACTAYAPVQAAVQKLAQQGKKLYYISDMYLPQTQINAMLRRPVCGGLRLLRLRRAEAQRQTVQTVFTRDGTGRQAGAFHRGQLARRCGRGRAGRDSLVASAHRPRPGV